VETDPDGRGRTSTKNLNEEDRSKGTIMSMATTMTMAGATIHVVPVDHWDPAVDEFELVTVDLYRDIHKGIRAELLSLVETAGSVDPTNREDRVALAEHILATHALLESHAHHEDGVIQPVLESELPILAERIERDHHMLDDRIGRIADMATSIDGATGDVRARTHLLYLDLARFTSEYFVHIDIEERVLMPALERAVGVEAVGAMNAAIVGAIPPDELARSLAFMLPAMNIDDRCELLGGIRAGAPPEVFSGVVDLARSVLRNDDYRALARRMGLS
jgi:hemerythrin-like domain-containing protein